MRHSIRLARTGSLVVVCLTLACGGGGSGPTYSNQPPGGTTPPPGSTSPDVTVTNNTFSPGATRVPVGTKVTWSWDACSNDGYGGQTCGSHSVTFDDGLTSGTQSTGSYSRTFTAAGTYRYHCAVHGASMSGSVTVE